MENPEINCSSGCLLDELDENSETLRQKHDDLEEIFQTADPDHPVTREDLAEFKELFDNFDKDFVLFREHCAKCQSHPVKGRIEKYARVYNRAHELWEILSA